MTVKFGHIISFTILLLFTGSCIDNYMPNNIEHESSIYIEAILTDNSTIRPSVTMMKSVPIDKNLSQYNLENSSYIDSAEVYIIADDGSEYLLEYEEEGRYLMQDENFEGSPGNYYKVVIYYNDDIYESDFNLLKASPAVDSISYKVKEEKLSEDGNIAEGYEFRVSTNDQDNEDCYYRWIVDVTYSYTVPYIADYIWSGRYLRNHDNSDLLHCWKTFTIPSIFVATTAGLSENAIIESPLHFESQIGYALSETYYIKIYQLKIDESTYDFWSGLDKLINKTGGLYETQPFRLKGNISCVTNPEQRVMGNFEVAGLSESYRYFETPDEFPVLNNFCSLEEVGTESYSWFEVDSDSRIIYNPTTRQYFTADLQCFDCTSHGGVTEMPSFWEFK